MKLIELSTDRPVSIFIFALAAVVFGVVAFGNLATDLLPDISYPSLTVQTEYDGAAPMEIEGWSPARWRMPSAWSTTLPG